MESSKKKDGITGPSAIKEPFSFLINILVTRKRYALLFAVGIALFLVFYYIVSPSNFSSFSGTLRNFISALGTLLAVVVSFNTLSLQNQLKNMPTNMKNLDEQIKKISELLQPIIDVRNAEDANRLQNELHLPKEIKQHQLGNKKLFKNATLYFTDALESLFVVVMEQAKTFHTAHKDNEKEHDNEFVKVCMEIDKKLKLRLEHYRKNKKNPYYLVSLSSTDFIQQLNFISFTFDNDKTKSLFQNVKKLHIIRNIGVRIYIRNLLASLSYEMLILTIPVIAYTGAIASISNYGNYDAFLLRILFAVSISTATMPFVLLLIRTIPILHIIKGSSSIPFSSNM